MKTATTDKEIKNDGQMTKKVGEGVFILCEASKLSLEDEFMKHEPRTDNEESFKKELKKAIQRGVNDFLRPKYDPSFDLEGKICYVPDAKPAVGKSYSWWKENAEKYIPGKSRLGRKEEYLAFLATLIKKLVSEGWRIDAAWDAVCNDSRDLGNYRNNNGAKRRKLELTGSRKIACFYDLANTFKILSSENAGFWNASGSYYCNSGDIPLSEMDKYYSYNDKNDYGVGWIVLTE